MKKSFLFVLMLISTLAVSGCKFYVNANGSIGSASTSESSAETVEVNLKGFTNLEFTIYDEDYNIYKTGTFASSTPIVIKHFKKGFYQIAYSANLRTGPSSSKQDSQYQTFEINEPTLITISTNVNSTTSAQSFKFTIESLPASK